MRPAAAPATARPILKEPTWTWEIPLYFYTGGLAGASATLAAAAQAAGNDELARRTRLTALGAIGVSPALLISDLGRPARFLNMLRVFKITSPMSVGSWLLAATAPCVALANASALAGRAPRAGRAAGVAAALLGLPLSTYTAALIANTAVPVWHDARRVLPAVFAAGAAASAGGAGAALTPVADAGPARRLAIAGAIAELAATRMMERRLGGIADPYHHGPAAPLVTLAKALAATGGALMAAGAARSRPVAIAGGVLLNAGAVVERWAVYKAGFSSAADREQTVGPQRRRITSGAATGA